MRGVPVCAAAVAAAQDYSVLRDLQLRGGLCGGLQLLREGVHAVHHKLQLLQELVLQCRGSGVAEPQLLLGVDDVELQVARLLRMRFGREQRADAVVDLPADADHPDAVAVRFVYLRGEVRML